MLSAIFTKQANRARATASEKTDAPGHFASARPVPWQPAEPLVPTLERLQTAGWKLQMLRGRGGMTHHHAYACLSEACVLDSGNRLIPICEIKTFSQLYHSGELNNTR